MTQAPTPGLLTSDWTPWSGGPRPHPPATRVRVCYRDGTEDEGQSAFARWWHEGNDRDILAYKLAAPVEATERLFDPMESDYLHDLPMDAPVEASGSEREALEAVKTLADALTMFADHGGTLITRANARNAADHLRYVLSSRPQPSGDQITDWARALYNTNTFYKVRDDWHDMAPNDGGIHDLHMDMARAAKHVWDHADSPQPSGETRERARSVERIKGWLERNPQGGAEPIHPDDLRALIRPAPVGSGGQHSSGEATFLGHLVAPKSGVGAVFVPKGEPVPLMDGRGSVTPVYSGPQNVTTPVAETAGEAVEPNALPIDLAPRDGTMLRLWVRYPEEGSWTPLTDAYESWTVGFNNFNNTEDDRWQVVGWCWSHDQLLEAADDVEVMGWLPFHGEQATPPVPAQDDDKLQIAVEALEKIRNRRSIVFGRGEMSGQEAFGIATEALAALQQEG